MQTAARKAVQDRIKRLKLYKEQLIKNPNAKEFHPDSTASQRKVIIEMAITHGLKFLGLR